MKLKPGMTANIVIYTKEVNNAMLIPAKALSFTPDSTLMKGYQIVGKVSHKGMHKGGGGASGNQVSHAASSRKDSSGVSKQKALIWVLQGKKLVQKRITIGLNDNTHVEVLEGLTANEMVATGITGGAAGSSAATTPGASPFLPARRPNGGSAGGGRPR